MPEVDAFWRVQHLAQALAVVDHGLLEPGVFALLNEVGHHRGSEVDVREEGERRKRRVLRKRLRQVVLELLLNLVALLRRVVAVALNPAPARAERFPR